MASTNTGIESPVNQSADIRRILGATGGIYALARNPNVNKWSVYKPIYDNAGAIDIQGWTDRYNPVDQRSHRVPVATGEMDFTEGASFGTYHIPGHWWKVYGMRVAVIDSVAANDIASASMGLSDWPAFSLSEVPSAPGRHGDFRGYRTTAEASMPFNYSITDAYTNEPAIASFQVNNGGQPYSVGAYYLLAALGQDNFGSWVPTVVVRGGASDLLFPLPNPSSEPSGIETVSFPLTGLSFGADVNLTGAFCLRNTTLGKTIIFPSNGSRVNPAPFRFHHSGAPIDYLYVEPFSEGFLGYGPGYSFMNIMDMESPSMGMKTTGMIRFRFVLHNTRGIPVTLAANDIAITVDESTYARILYGENGNTPLSSITVPASGSVVLEAEMYDLISSGRRFIYARVFCSGSDISDSDAEIKLIYGTPLGQFEPY